MNYCTSTGFIPRALPQLPNSAEITNTPLVVTDLNGDGLSDIFRLWSEWNASNYHMDRLYNRGSHTDFELRTQMYDGPWGLASTLATDLNGDGRAEVINPGTAFFPPEVMLFEALGHERSVEKVVDGMGAATEYGMAYLSEPGMLGLEPDNDAYTWPNGQGHPALEVTQAMMVPDGIGGQNTTTYAFGWGQMNRTGRGFIGFRHRTTSSSVLNTTTFEGSIVNMDYAELVPETSTVENTSNPELLSTIEYTFDHQPLGDPSLKRHLTRAISTITTDERAGTVSETFNTAWDAFGNVTASTAHVNGIVTTLTNSTYVAAGPSQVPSKLEDITVITTRDDQPTVSKRTHHTYWQTNGTLRRITEYFGTIEGLTKEFVPSLAGPVASTAEHYPGLAASQWRRENFLYDAKYRFPESHSRIWTRHGADFPVTTITHYEPFWGKPKDMLSSDGLTTIYDHNAFGRLQATWVPHIAGTLRHAITDNLSWDVDGDLRYFRRSVDSPGGADVITQHDLLGRTLTEQHEALGSSPSTPIYSTVDYTYDYRGNVYTQTTPHLPTESYLTVTHEFDQHNRPYRDLHPTAGETNYAYEYADGLLKSKVTTDAGIWRETITDATGKTVASRDDGGMLEHTYDSWGNVKKTVLNEYVLTQNTYDGTGQQTTLALMNGGTTHYQYDHFGQLVWQRNANGSEMELSYDNLGRIATREDAEGLTKYAYFHENGRINDNLVAVQSPTSEHSYAYDDPFNRLSSETWQINGQNYTYEYGYDAYDRISERTYPSGFAVQNLYANNGSLIRVLHGQDILFNGLEQNGQGRYTRYQLGDEREVHKDYSTEGFITHIRAQDVQDLHMEYEASTGNMKYRWDQMRQLKESFTYDELDRLITSLVEEVDGNGSAVGTVSDETYRYDGSTGSSFGDLVMRSSVGRFGYNGQAVTAARHLDYPTPPDAPPVGISLETQQITYTPFLKTATITEDVGSDTYELSYEYGPERHRIRSVLRLEGSVLQEMIYAGAYEKLMTEDEWFENHYIQGGDGLCAIVVKNNGTWQFHAAYTDHLGSIVAVTEMNTGAIVAEQNFDPWGRHRKPSSWGLLETAPDLPLWLYRGFTGHEHVAPFALINMNGRMYDPANGRMLGVDNYVQSGLGTQGYNRYSYAGNNPLKYTDPTGDFVWYVPIVVGAVAGAYIGGAIDQHEWNPGKWEWKDNSLVKSMTVGGILGAALGASFTAAYSATGWSFFGKIAGMASNSTSSFIGSTPTAWNIAANGLLQGSVNIGSAYAQGGGLEGAFTGGIIGLVSGGLAPIISGTGMPPSSQPMKSDMFLKWNLTSSMMNGFLSRTYESLSNGQTLAGAGWNGILGAGEGYLSAMMLDIPIINRGFGIGARRGLSAVSGRYLSSFFATGLTSVPGAGFAVTSYLPWQAVTTGIGATALALGVQPIANAGLNIISPRYPYRGSLGGLFEGMSYLQLLNALLFGS